MSGQTAVITGASSGIGRATARHLAAQGWAVASFDVSPPAEPDPAIEDHVVDVADNAAVDAAMRSVAERHGGLQLAVNNAGITKRARLEDLTFEEWDAVVGVNLHGAFNGTQAAGRIMLAQDGGGSIVNIVSVAADRGQPGRAPYGATKAGIVGLTKTAAVEWATRGVRVNAVGPGYVSSGVYEAALASGQLDNDEVLGRIPMRRLAEADEIASVIAFLASPAASYVTGHVLYADGGFLADFGIGVVGID
ncbi:SDR family NAD(P)-dependent oxidoreductase [Conexibacter woesei]|uniref:Short-chain dehydrogenase/reductase SDR n=1 Tax=Conexibacter woesei (strain DSM 14684 / CCUG 47730 / CIP 108061 / JCM 11494 / NBRC 100937 / ID131577) TaxID=469383 RepID=D3F4X8_CONWI|nr:SDR family NAD(P)-dependent oxidoreductase [Conexibacter woesei]ADB48556.1 short-chain dehydrogenase/reductase SDR [Conexibacter woesei DSM 14684]